MKKLYFIPFIALAMTMGSCGSKATIERLQAQNDSLVRVNTQAQADFDDVMQILNDVEDGFRQIRNAENFLASQKSGEGEVTLSTREQIKNDMALVNETLQNNKKRLDTLQRQLRNSNRKSAELQKTIERLQQEIEEKTALIVSLQEALAQRDVRIAELDVAVANLNKENGEQRDLLSSQDAALNTGYYMVAKRKELKADKVLVKGKVLNSDEADKAGFTKVDIRNFKELPLASKRAKVLTSHPAGSYQLVKGDDKMITLVINDPVAFWSVSKYLVISK